MAIKSLIFDYQTAEDEYTASDFREVYKHFVSNGVLLEKEDSLLDNTKCKVVAIEGGVRISNGTAQINGSQAIITDEDILIETDGTYKIILEWNVVLNKFVAKAITDLALTRTDTVYQIQLAQVVKSGAVYTVTDSRNDEAVCGYANRLLDNQADALQAQIENGWNKLVGTFTYSNSTTITTSADCTSFLSAGTKLKFTNGTVKMSVIKSVTSTTIVLETAVLASGVITDVYFSIAETPNGVFSKGQIINGSTKGIAISAGTTKYIGQGISDNVYYDCHVFPVAGTIKNLFLISSGSPGTGQTYTGIIIASGTETNVRVIIPNGTNSARDSSNSYYVEAGARVTLKWISSSGAAKSFSCTYGFMFYPDIATNF